MTTATPPTRPPPPPRSQPAPRNALPQNNHAASQANVLFAPIRDGTGHRIGMYGPGGIGKSTLAATAPGPVVFFDLDDSLSRLRASFTEAGLKHDIRVVEVATWQDIRDALHAPGWDDTQTIVIDSATRAEEWAVADTIATVPHEKQGVVIKRIEDYGYGKGYSHVFDTFLKLLADLDQHARAGRNVILICHDCTNEVPNPQGDNWLRYEPRLQSPTSGKASIRLRVREWLDHLLFIGYDVNVDKGKGEGSGTRMIYTYELPHCMAKTRPTIESIPYVKFDTALWTELLK